MIGSSISKDIDADKGQRRAELAKLRKLRDEVPDLRTVEDVRSELSYVARIHADYQTIVDRVRSLTDAVDNARRRAYGVLQANDRAWQNLVTQRASIEKELQASRSGEVNGVIAKKLKSWEREAAKFRAGTSLDGERKLTDEEQAALSSILDVLSEIRRGLVQAGRRLSDMDAKLTASEKALRTFQGDSLKASGGDSKIGDVLQRVAALRASVQDTSSKVSNAVAWVNGLARSGQTLSTSSVAMDWLTASRGISIGLTALLVLISPSSVIAGGAAVVALVLHTVGVIRSRLRELRAEA